MILLTKQIESRHFLQVSKGISQKRNGPGVNLFAFKGVDDRTLSRVGIANKTDGDLLLIWMQFAELTQQIDERAWESDIVADVFSLRITDSTM